jgi:hypothetical protein
MTGNQRLIACSAAEQTTEQAEHRVSVRGVLFLKERTPEHGRPNKPPNTLFPSPWKRVKTDAVPYLYRSRARTHIRG